MGTGTITGNGSKFTISGNLTIGETGLPALGGSLTVEQSAILTINGSNLVLGDQLNSTGVLTIDGANSKVLGTGAAHITIGKQGKGVLDLIDGGQFTLDASSAAIQLGVMTGSNGIIKVDGSQNGTPSTFTAQGGSIVVGSNTRGEVDITGGGIVNSLGNLVIGANAHSTGVVEVSDSMSQWNHPISDQNSSSSDVAVGQSGTGNLTVSNGATFGGGNISLGVNTNSTGTITLTGVANGMTELQSANLFVGVSGMGTLNASVGAHLNTGQDVVLGNSSGGRGVVELDSASIWQMNGGSITVGLGGTGDLSLYGGSKIQNAGTMILGGVGGNGKLTIGGEGSTVNGLTALTLGSGGILSITDGAQMVSNTAVLTVGGSNSAITVDGMGTNSRATLTVNSWDSSNIQTFALTVKNQGVFNVTSGFLDFAEDQTNAHITIDSGAGISAPNSPLQYSNAKAGSFFTVGGGSLTTSGVEFDGGGQSTVTIDGAFWNIQTSDSQVGRFVADSGINVSISNSTISADAFAVIQGQSTVTVDGNNGHFSAHSLGVANSSTFQVSNGAIADISAPTTGETSALSVDSGSTVKVLSGGNLSAPRADIQSGSTLDLSQNGYAYFDSKVTNSGSIDAGGSSNSGGMDLGLVLGRATNGQIRVGLGGTLKDNGTITATSVNMLGGTLGGSGTINGKLINGGTVAPGDPQTLTVNGDYEQDDGGILDIVAIGTDASSYDRLVVTGNLSLMNGAVLEFDFMNGFAPRLGDTFDFLSFGTIDPTHSLFSSIQITGLEPGFEYTIAPDPTDPLSFALVALNDGVASTVPEPTAAILLLVGGGSCFLFRMRRRRRRT